MGMSQGTGVNRDTGMDNMAHVNKGQSKSTWDEGVVKMQGEAQQWQVRQGCTQRAARTGMDNGVTSYTFHGGGTVGMLLASGVEYSLHQWEADMPKSLLID